MLLWLTIYTRAKIKKKNFKKENRESALPPGFEHTTSHTLYTRVFTARPDTYMQYIGIIKAYEPMCFFGVHLAAIGCNGLSWLNSLPTSTSGLCGIHVAYVFTL